jgi:hypothetical protein
MRKFCFGLMRAALASGAAAQRLTLQYGRRRCPKEVNAVPR